MNTCRYVDGTSDSVNGPCPGAKKLIECIKFWSNSNIWASVVHLREVSSSVEDWAELQKYRQKWLHQRNTVLPRPIFLPEIIVPGFAGSLIPSIWDYSRCLRQILDIALDGSRKLPRDLYLARIEKIISSARLIQGMISCVEQKLNLEEKDFLMDMTEESSHEENLERYSWGVVTNLTEMVLEELDYDNHTPLPYENTEDKGTIYSQFESMHRSGLRDWLDLLGAVEKMFYTEGCSFGGAGHSTALGSFDTSSIVDAIYDWVDGFENVNTSFEAWYVGAFDLGHGNCGKYNNSNSTWFRKGLLKDEGM
ncbi:hypothetical protein M434DRAFT_14113 [Hypoxylon sp. CO27-5]|nr:hypothetical protein M434DRAFT_14113 [Hypoxylon sp. CO27-5]